MKRAGGNLTLLLLLIPLFLSAQTPVYELNAKDQPLASILTDLEIRYDLHFSYVDEEVQAYTLTVQAKSADLTVFLSTLFRATYLDFSVLEGNYVILTRHSFVPKEADVPRPPLSQLCGQVVDSLGQAIPYVNAYILRTRKGRTATENGEFQFAYALQAADTLVISSIGFVSQRFPARAFLDPSCLTVRLTPASFETGAIVIADYLTDGIELAENGSATVLKPGRIQALPGQGESDVLNTLQFLPGINAPDRAAANLYIRGGTPDQNLFLWEKIPLYHTAYYFGMISAFNPQIIDQIRVYRGGFGPEYGGRISAVIDMQSPDHSLSQSSFGAGVNLLNAFTDGKVPFGGGKAALVYSLRRSITDIWQSPTFASMTNRNLQGILYGRDPRDQRVPDLNFTNDFSFLDSHLKLSVQASDKDEVSLAWFYGQSDFEAEIRDPRRRLGQKDALAFDNMGGSLQWKHQWTPALETELTGLRLNCRYDYRYSIADLQGTSQTDREGSKGNQIDEAQFHLHHRYTSPQGHQLSLGYQWIQYDVDYVISQGNRVLSQLDERVHFRADLHGFHAGIITNPAAPWGIEVGLRNTYFAPRDRSYVSPRIRLWYQATEGLSFHANAGKYYQFLSQLLEFRGDNAGIQTPVWVLAGSPEVPVLSATQYQVGLLWHKGSWVWDLQAYRKQIDGLTSFSIDFGTTMGNRYHLGQGTVRGLDVMVKKRWRYYKSWISYSLSEVNYSFPTFFDPNFPAGFDQRHVLNWAHLFHWNAWEASLGFKLASGKPYAEMVDFSIVQGPQGNEIFWPVYHAYNGERLPWQHQLDASLLYQFQSGKTGGWRGRIGLSCLNLYNQTNLYSREYFVERSPLNPPTLNFVDKANLGFTPNAVLRLEW